MNTSTNIPSSAPVVTCKLTVVPTASVAPSVVPVAARVARVPAANVNAKPDPEVVARRRAVEAYSYDELAAQLQEEGAKSFVSSWNELMAVITSKSAALKKAS